MNINDNNAINEIKALGIDMIANAKSGHPGIVLSAAPILYTLYSRHMNIVPNNPDWLNRDRFILSAGHGSALLYATLFMCGFDIKEDDLKQFRSIDSILSGHPEKDLTPGVDMSTGALGQGIANAVGIAMGERYLSNLVQKYDKNQNLIDYRTYVLCGDGDLMEGISYEACSFAGTQQLDKLMILYDCNKMTNDGSTKDTFGEDIKQRFEAMGFYAEIVKDSLNVRTIDKAINNSKKSHKPSIVIFSTILGKDSMNENKNVVHGTPLSDDDVFALKKKLNITIAPFEVRKDTIMHVRNLISERVTKKYKKNIEYFNQLKNSGNQEMIRLLQLLINKEVEISFDSANYRINEAYNEDLRTSNHKVLNLVASKTPFILGGSADMASSTKTFIDNTMDNTPKTPLGRNINFGIREQAMAGILNGLSSLGLKTYCSTMLAFSDYMKAEMRMSALMNLPVTYIFTHDSISIGEDGPTHEPVEQLCMLRSIPNMVTFRPCDINEIMGCWEYIAKANHPVNLVISKNNVSKVYGSNSKSIFNGAYIIKKEEQKLDGIIIATGTEVEIAINIKEELKKENLDVRIVSMPSMELFRKSGKEYRDMVLPSDIKKVVLEPSSKMGWGLFVEEEEDIIGINDFGYSGHPNEVLKKMNYDYDSIKLKITKQLLKNK